MPILEASKSEQINAGNFLIISLNMVNLFLSPSNSLEDGCNASTLTFATRIKVTPYRTVEPEKRMI